MNENNKKEYQKKPAKWYIASTINSNEINAVKNLQAKIKAIHYEDLIPDVKLIMNKLVKNFYFDENDPSNKPPRSMKNTVNTTWSVLGNGKYKKQVVKLENKYPGYIFVQMNMTDESWYAVRNSPKITGLVGSSGSGIKPQPIDNEEVENILNNVKPYNEYAIVVEEQIVGDNEKQNSFGTNENNKDLEKLNSTNLANIKLRIGNTVAANIGSEKIVGTIVAIDEEKKQVILKTTMLGQENELTTAIENISIE